MYILLHKVIIQCNLSETQSKYVTFAGFQRPKADPAFLEKEKKWDELRRQNALKRDKVHVCTEPVLSQTFSAASVVCLRDSVIMFMFYM